VGFSLLAAQGALFAQQSDLPLHNWTVPPHREGASVSGGLTTMSDVTPGIAFVGVAPCRLVDTRTATVPNFPAGYGPPSMTAGVARNFDLNSDPQCPGIPAEVDSYSLNITVTNTLGPGFILIYPQGGAQPTVSTLNYVAGQTVANAAIVPAGTNGGVTVIAGVSGTNLIIDINGYFSDTLNAGNQVVILANSSQSALHVDNASSGGGSRAIVGNASATTGVTWGVLGHTHSSTATSAGVRGVALGASGGGTYGVQGKTFSPDFDSAGVIGENASGPVFFFPSAASGVRGESAANIGVLGLTTTGSGVLGARVNANGSIATSATLGGNATTGLHVTGNSQVTGTKSFVEPHPSDASKIIQYISLEGNESGTYFRGRGRFQNGLAVIQVPEDFRIVTDPEGLSIQVTPIGQMATVAVESIRLDRIVVRGSRNVEFFYTVNGIRHAYKDSGPIAENENEFVPMSPDARIPTSLAKALRERLVSNGTYKPDGTVNLETARRLGWDKEWEKRARPAPQPTTD